MRNFSLVLCLGLAVLLAGICPAAAPARKTENVLLVMLDGLRWEEVFNGADEQLITKERGGVKNVADCRKRFWRETTEARRETLLPFLWGTVAKDGQLFGNKSKNSVGKVTNKLNFSYPGYNEILCGFADPLVTSNAKVYNGNTTVLEFLHKKPEFEGKVAAFRLVGSLPLHHKR